MALEHEALKDFGSSWGGSVLPLRTTFIIRMLNEEKIELTCSRVESFGQKTTDLDHLDDQKHGDSSRNGEPWNLGGHQSLQ